MFNVLESSYSVHGPFCKITVTKNPSIRIIYFPAPGLRFSTVYHAGHFSTVRNFLLLPHFLQLQHHRSPSHLSLHLQRHVLCIVAEPDP